MTEATDEKKPPEGGVDGLEISYIANDVQALRASALESVPNHGGNEAPLRADGKRPVGAFVESFQGLIDHWIGYLVLVNQDFDDGGQRVSRSAAVRVDNVSEVVRVLEVLLKR